MVLSSTKIRFFFSNLFIFHHLVHCHCPKEFQCGSEILTFPFFSEPNCGLLFVECNGYPTIHTLEGLKERNWMISTQSNNSAWIVPSIKEERGCNVFNNITLPKSNSAISFYTSLPNVTMFKCTTHSSNQSLDALAGYNKFSECEKEHHFTIYYNYNDGVILDVVGKDYPSDCSIIQWPIGNRTFDHQFKHQLFYLLDFGFRLNWNLYGSCKECYLSGHSCRVDHDNLTCSEEGGLRKLGIIIGSVLFGVITIFAILTFWLDHSICKEKFHYKNIENFLEKGGSLGPERYSYSDIKRMTSSFKHKIGKGGFGTVFKGCLRDGSPVAVKLLDDSKGNGEDFINEVASISRTSHVNIVKLLGFCFKGNKRALVYEFMPKGSLEKFIFDDKSSPSLSHKKLEMKTSFKIAIGIARGLEYLHRLCATRIIHFDVKPHNVLLDEDFTPKISDFGLSKLSLREQNSVITLSGARGTIGYIAPEVVCRYLGSVSQKSDVYSYGMMILETVGGRRNIDNGADNTSQVYMPHWIYNQIQIDRNVHFLGIGNDEDEEYARKMIIVSFWCIQTDPLSRPTMTRVVEMLESKMESLEIPPRPYLFSAANSPFNQSTFEKQMTPGMGEVESLEMIEDDYWNSKIKKGGVAGDFSCDKELKDPSVLEETVLLKDMRVANSPVCVTDVWVSASSTISGSHDAS